MTESPGKVSDVMQAFHIFLGGNDRMAGLTMMSARIRELRAPPSYLDGAGNFPCGKNCP